ncbi:MAG: radical SAM protein, partial [Deltaproteobacteria bacterium]
PAPETVRALVDHYRRERRPAPDTPIEVAFFHGGIPPSPLVAAAAPHPMRLSCSPAGLTRDDVEMLIEAGLETIELELLSLDDDVLRATGRGYGRADALAVLRGVKELGLRVGVVLSPGLPGSSHRSAMHSARTVAGVDDPGLAADFVRLYPALGLAGSDLAARAVDGRWRPMDLGQAVTTLAAQCDLLEEAGVQVARIGLQPGADIPVRAVAGPVHPNLRALVQGRRFRVRMARALDGVPRGSRALLRVHPKDLSWAKGTANENIRALRARLGLPEIEVRPDARVRRGTVIAG